MFVIAVAAACLTACTPQPRAVSGIAMDDCMLGDDGRAERVQARCGVLQVPVDWREPKDTLELRLALLPAEGGQRAADPLFFVPGGPGQSALATFAQVAPAFAAVRRHRDIVLVDPRGTGGSTPLTCAYELPDDLEDEASRQRLAVCAHELGERPRFENSDSFARDLDAVRRAMGYARIDLYGASYGTRVVFTMLKLFPESVRAVVLDGVAAPQTSLGAAQMLSAERALQQLWLRCAQNGACIGRYRDLRSSFLALHARLAETPSTVAIRDPQSGERRQLTLTARLFEDTVRSALYQSELAAILPKIVTAAANGDDVGLASLAAMQRDTVAKAVNPLVYISVVCHEDIPFVLPSLKSEFFTTHLEEMRALCKLWPVQPGPKELKAPFVSDVPALLVSGENDPVTPPAEADRALQTLEHAASIVLPEQGHIGMYRGCMPRLIADFLDAGSADGLDTRCASATRALPLFTGTSGP